MVHLTRDGSTLLGLTFTTATFETLASPTAILEAVLERKKQCHVEALNVSITTDKADAHVYGAYGTFRAVSILLADHVHELLNSARLFMPIQMRSATETGH